MAAGGLDGRIGGWFSRAMAVISGLYVYPIKSCKGISCQEAELAETGLRFDRHWAVIDRHGEFVTQRDLPRMALVTPRLEADRLVLSAPGVAALALPLRHGTRRLEVRIWGDRCFGLDQGDEAARWLRAFLDRDLRLARFDDSAPRHRGAGHGAEQAASTEFADGYAILVLSEASLGELNGRLEKPVPMNRFRPNIVLAGVDAHDEDHFRALEADGVELRLVKPCIRCQITLTDQDTGEVGTEPLHTLASYRSHPKLGGVAFGQNAVIARGAGRKLHLGQALEEVWNF